MSVEPLPSSQSVAPPMGRRRLPIVVKVAAVAFNIALIVAYSRHYGPANFLWFSNLSLFLLTLGIVFESPLLVSMPAVGVLLLEAGWSADFVFRLVTGRRALGITDYFWNPTYPAPVRALTLYHVALPPTLWWVIGRLGYDRRAFIAWLALAGTTVALVVTLTDPARNINRLWSLGAEPQQALPRPMYLVMWATLLTAGFWWPTHRLLLWARPRASVVPLAIGAVRAEPSADPHNE